MENGRFGLKPEGTKHLETVEVGNRFISCLKALRHFFWATAPPTITVRSQEVVVVVYGFVDTLGGGFGSTLLEKGKIKYRIGTWSSQESQNSSNWREFENLVESVENLGEEEKLQGSQVVLATDNQVVESALYKGNSSSQKLYELVVRLRTVELRHSAHLFITHVAGTRMMSQGTDAVSRGCLNTGVAVGESMVNFCPWAKGACDVSPSLVNWVRSWDGRDVELLEPKDWFVKGHDIVGGKTDEHNQ